MSETCEIYEFGDFRLDPAHRSLTGAEGPVALSSRGFDILSLLVEHRDRVVTKDEIMSHVWRGTIVEENNLAVQISALRRALTIGADGAPLIVTVAGQGYRFVGRLKEAPDTIEPLPEPPPPQPLPPIAEDAPPVPGPGPRPSRRVGWIALVLIGVAVTAIVTWRLSRQIMPQPAQMEAPVPPRLSIAVLPFRNLGDDEKDNYLADAVSDDVTTDLSHIPGSVVIARESSDTFRGRAVPTDKIGRELNVRYLLEGSLRRVEDNFSINAQLIEAATGAHIWAERFRVPRVHIAETQEIIVRRLASALGVTLVDAEGDRSLQEHAANPDALDLFLRARSILDRSDTLDGMTQAQKLLEQAIAVQPDYADAFSALGWLLLRKVHGFAEPDEMADWAEARSMVARALVLAPNSPEALSAQGMLDDTDGNCQAAQASYHSALSFDNNNVAAQTGLAHCLVALGKFDEAVGQITALLRIDPEGSRNRLRFQAMGLAYIMLGRPTDALTWLDRASAGDAAPKPGAGDLGRVEWGKLLRIGATAMLGDTTVAHTLFVAYARVWPNRTTWHLSCQFTKAQAQTPNFHKFIEALHAAGMPDFADEHADQGIDPVAAPDHRGEFSPTPMRVPGAQTIDTKGLAALLQTQKPVVIDMGFGAGAISGTEQPSFDPESEADITRLGHDLRQRSTLAGRPVVVMGDSSYGWKSYNTALQLVAAGVPGLLWYRGGEEAWAAAGMPSEDKRSH